MAGINSGMLNNAYPLSPERIKELERLVLENQDAFVYLDEEGKLCFALPKEPEDIRALAWNNAYELATGDAVLIKKAYIKTGPESYKLKETLQKGSYDDSWSEAGRLVLKAIDGKVPEGWGYSDYQIETYSSVWLTAGDSLPDPGPGDEMVHLADDFQETGSTNASYYFVTNEGPYTLEETRERFKEEICKYWGRSSWEDYLTGEFGTSDIIEDEEFWNHLMIDEMYFRDTWDDLGWVYLTEKSFVEYPSVYWQAYPQNDSTVYDEILDIPVISRPSLIQDGDYLVLQEGEKRLQRWAFQDNQELTKVRLPKSLTYIDEAAFSRCTNLEKVIIQGDADVHYMVFEGCPLLKTAGPIGGDYNIEFSWTTVIPECAFDRCESLESIVIPESVSKIGDRAFDGCSALRNITFSGTIEQWNAITLGAGWNAGVPATDVICTDGSVCLICTGGTATCQEKAICEKCGREYGEYGPHSSVDGTCTVCGIECTTIESEHNPYSTNNFTILGTWDYSTAKSVNITVTYQTPDYSNYCTIARGHLYSARDGMYGDYLTTSGVIGNYRLGRQNITGFYGSSKQTFENVDMLQGSVIFKSSAADYYGVHVTVIPNY